MTDATGWFSLTATVDNATRFRASKEGHLDGTTTLVEHAEAPPGYVSIILAPVSQPVSIAGEYTLTFIADSGCGNIPPDMRTRTYAATIEADTDSRRPPGTSFWATIHGVSTVPGRGRIPIGVAGTTVLFGFGEHGWPYFAEQVTADRIIWYDGHAVFSVTTPVVSTLSTSFRGWVGYGAELTALSESSPTCESSNHQFIVTRR